MQPASPAAAKARIIPAYVALFFTIGLALPYWPAWLESRDMSPALIGVLLGIGPWVRLSLNPLVGRFADKHGIAHRLVVAGAAILATSYFGLFWWGDSLFSIAALVLIGAIGFGPLVPLVDSVALRSEHIDYGRIRSWGSAAFIAASFGGGWLLDGSGADAILLGLWACALAMLFAGLALPPPPPRPSNPSQASPWQTSGFVLFLATAALLNASHAMLYGFGTLHWRGAGVSETAIGVLWSIGVVAEILLFTIGGRIVDRLGFAGLFVTAAVGGIVRWLLLASSSAFPALLGAQLLHAATFACMHMGAMVFIRERVDPEATSRATALYSAVATGLAMGLCMPASGFIYERFAGPGFLAMATLSSAALVCALVLRRIPPSQSAPIRPPA